MGSSSHRAPPPPPNPNHPNPLDGGIGQLLKGRTGTPSPLQGPRCPVTMEGILNLPFLERLGGEESGDVTLEDAEGRLLFEGNIRGAPLERRASKAVGSPRPLYEENNDDDVFCSALQNTPPPPPPSLPMCTCIGKVCRTTRAN